MITYRMMSWMGLCLCVVTSLVHAGDWSYWRGPQGTGVSEESDWKTSWPARGPQILWEAQVGAGFSTVTVSQGKLYTQGNVGKGAAEKDVVTCLDAKTGKLLWTHEYPEPKNPKYYKGGTSATPTISDGKVYTLSREGKAFCLNASNGDVIWDCDLAKTHGIKKPEWGHAGSPLVLNGVVYLNAGTHGMALSAQDGSLVWKNGNGPAGYASVVPFTSGLQDSLQLILFGAETVAGVQARDGEVLWTSNWKTKYKINAANPLIFGDKIFVSSGYGMGCGLLKVEGRTVREVYTNKKMRNQCYGSVPYKGYIYGFDGQVNGGGKLTCMDPMTGEVKWQHKGLGTGTTMVAGDKLVVLGEKGTLVIAKAQPDAFVEIASAQVLDGLCWTVPVLADGLLYVRDAAGNLKCVDLR